MGASPTLSKDKKVLKALWIDTPLGPMLAIGEDHFLHLLEFIDRRGLEKEIERLRVKMKAAIVPGPSPLLKDLKNAS